ncbi:hypothetical protein [Streptomyces omiyaensis]|uniref:Uncharacterized protein n=1 Tax=Streptomyces omiyaensis TaxID=68247 RepID=A0ABW7BN29_9ACTN
MEGKTIKAARDQDVMHVTITKNRSAIENVRPRTAFTRTNAG